MKTIKIITIALLQLILINGYSQVDKAFDDASKYYQNKEYTQSISIYDSLLNSGIESFELYYNMGNSYFKKEDFAKAILYYEKAKKIAPNNEDLNYNLSVANQHIVDKIDPLPTFILKQWWINFVNLFSEKQWAVINIIFWGLFLVLTYIFFTTSGGARRKMIFWTGIIMLIFSLITGLSGYKQYQNIHQNKTAIVMTPTVNIKSSPSAESNTVFVIHQGTKVWLKVKIKNWYQIKIANGSQGWIKVEDVEKI